MSIADLPSDLASEPAPPPPRKSPSTPPKASRSRSADRTPSAGPKFKSIGTDRKAAYKEGLSGVLQLAAGVALPFAPADAAAVLVHGENVSEAIADLGANDERIGALLDKLIQVGPYGAVIAAIAPMFAQIAVNHGALPAGVLGTMPPNELVMSVLGTESKGDSANDDRESSSGHVHA